VTAKDLTASATEEMLDGEPTIASVVGAEEQDIDPETWLNQDDTNVTGKVQVRGGTLEVAALTQGELTRLRKLARKINMRDPKGEPIVDPDVLNRGIIAFALSKASGKQIDPERLENKLTGDLTVIAKRILRISGFEDANERSNPMVPFG
jgi:hypothetical protein